MRLFSSARNRSIVMVALMCWSGVAVCAAEAFPTKQIRILVPAAPGGGLDITTRLVAQKMSENLQQSIIVENRAGGDTLIGTRQAKDAPPDGYTLLAQANGYTALPVIRKDSGFDPVKDFKPIGMMLRSAQVMYVPQTETSSTVQDFVKRASSEPGQLSYGSAGVGGPPHLGAALFFAHTGLNVIHVPYKGTGAAFPDVVAARVSTMFGSYVAGAAYLQSGRLRALGVTGATRLAALPNVPTMREQGIDFTYYYWLGLFAPAGTPAEVVTRLSDALKFAVNTPDIKRRLQEEGAEAGALSPREFQQQLALEFDQMKGLLKGGSFALK